jgi:c(7)-type cytochrome triheme protein
MTEPARVRRNAIIRTAVPVVCILAGLAAAFHRFTAGLGASTRLTDAFPWGVWIGMDLVGIALSGGGFVVAFIVYILGKDSYQSIARTGILVALLGYPLVASVLILDLGQPHRFWHALLFWNHHSAMFEVTVCVTFYSGVLFLEFAPEILRAFGRRSLGERLHRFMPVVAGVGIVLSTLHQSSLGTLFLLVPTRMHPFWFSPFLPIHFWATAIQGGLAMVIVVHGLVHLRSGVEFHTRAIFGLGRALGLTIVLTLSARLVELTWRGAWAAAATYESTLLGLEIGLGALLPLILLARTGRRPARYFVAAILAVLGIILNRFNVTITAMESYHQQIYLPSATEILTSLAVLAAGVGLYALVARLLDLFPPHPGPRLRLLDATGILALAAAVVVAAGGWGLAVGARPGPVASRANDDLGRAAIEPPSTETRRQAARGVDALAVTIGDGIYFPHEAHDMGCPACHMIDYLILPGSGSSRGRGHLGSGCGRCHDGRIAFGLETACRRCHIEPPKGGHSFTPPAEGR